MNKYLEALIKLEIYAWSDNNIEIGRDDLEIYQSYDLLRELVEKSTPMKKEISETNNLVIHTCPVCHSLVTDFARFCENCGQRLE